MTFWALSPLLLLLTLLLLFRRPLFQAAPILYFYMLVLCNSYWSVPSLQLAAGALKGFLIACDIGLIIFGAILFQQVLSREGLIKKIEDLLVQVSPDRRVQALLLLWIFGAFIEGSSGFGTPAAILAPLLISIGFPLMKACVLSLVANSVSVTFGALGTPLRVGFAGLPTEGVATLSAGLNLLLGSLIPIMLLAILTGFPRSRERRPFWEMLPWALWISMIYLVPAYFVSYLGPEFPSLLGSLCAFSLVIYSIKKKFLLPKSTWRFDSDVPHQMELRPVIRPQGLLRIVAPYLYLLGFLLGGKFLLANASVNIDLFSSGLRHRISFFNPAWGFVLALLVALLSRQFSPKTLIESAKKATQSLFRPFLSIFFISAFVQTLFLTEGNPSVRMGVFTLIVQEFRSEALPIFSPFIGALGAFLAGSATVSNLLFGPLQVELAEAMKISLPWILALQLLGSSIGNMIALPNILAVSATVGIKNREVEILRQTILPCIFYLTILGLLAWTITNTR